MVAFRDISYSQDNERRPVVIVDRDDLGVDAQRALEEARQGRVDTDARVVRANELHAQTERNVAEIAEIVASMGQRETEINTAIEKLSDSTVERNALLFACDDEHTLDNQRRELEFENFLRDNAASNPPPNAASARFRMQLLRTLGVWVTISALSMSMLLMPHPQFASPFVVTAIRLLVLLVICVVELLFIGMRLLRNINGDIQNQPGAGRILQQNSYQTINRLFCNFFRSNVAANGIGRMSVVNPELRPA